MQSNIYTDPFANECSQYAQRFDYAYDSGDWEVTKHLISECEKLVKLHPDEYAYAPIYYSLGTSYNNLIQVAGENSSDAMQEKGLHYYRICIELLDADELKKRSINHMLLD